MMLRLLALLFFCVCTTSFCTGQHFYVYDEETLIDSLVASWPAGLSAEKDSLQIDSLGKSKIADLKAWLYRINERCYFSPEEIEKAEAKFRREPLLLENAEALLHNIIPSFDSIVKFTITERIQQFAKDNDLPLVSAHAILYKEEE